MHSDDGGDPKTIAAIVFITPHGVLGQYFDPVGQEKTPHDIEQRAANVIVPKDQRLH